MYARSFEDFRVKCRDVGVELLLPVEKEHQDLVQVCDLELVSFVIVISDSSTSLIPHPLAVRSFVLMTSLCADR